jgi:predicted nucleotidyltransferase
MTSSSIAEETSRGGHSLDEDVRRALSSFPFIELGVLFGSQATHRASAGSDVDVAVLGASPLGVDERIAIAAAIAEATGRPVDLVDLAAVPEPLLGQIVLHGRRLVGSESAWARLIVRHLFDEADFIPYQRRILSERLAAWIR